MVEEAEEVLTRERQEFVMIVPEAAREARVVLPEYTS
jgi:hypothetical protein